MTCFLVWEFRPDRGFAWVDGRWEIAEGGREYHR